MRTMVAAMLCMLFAAGVRAAVIGAEVSYRAGDTVMKGYLAYDDAIQGKRPGVLVVHEWWGHNEYARKRARMLAELGYTALAVDMYGDGKTAEHPEDAGKFATAVNSDMAQRRARFLAAKALLERHPTVAADAIAAIGYCFGGGVVLNMAREGVDLRAVASFHGAIASRKLAEPGTVKARVLVLNGAADPMVTERQIEVFHQEMTAAGVDYRFVNYAGARHAFTNPDADGYGQRFGLPLAYHPEADARSWAELKTFLRDTFGR
ncbi:dienelactone hydrolase family protein [Sulfurivermis fontis]|uniref:dienelactone hydrolase family protein n=1 Tax=Sulfurivermis fontis TaxID=1972068 RepID=UPI000FDA7868|nr:dienelactone hydrolase family protein [Sulfurivermis fontis]